VAFSYSIENSIVQGRKRIAFTCAEVIAKTGAEIFIRSGLL
jgi:hypothetical protein